MNGNVQSLLSGLLQKENRSRLAVLLGGAAMVLILVSALLPTGKVSTASDAVKASTGESAYQKQLESQLTGLIEEIQGAGNTVVMVTLESTEETIYAVDTQSGQMQSQEKHVLLDDGSALEETTCMPTISGVAVVCDGGGDVRIAARITELIRALLGLPANRICVEQRKG